jgi:hypothetical protein
MGVNDYNLLKISVPLPFREIYRTIPLSAKQILLDSPFNINENLEAKLFNSLIFSLRKLLKNNFFHKFCQLTLRKIFGIEGM